MKNYQVSTGGEPAWILLENHRPEGAMGPKTEASMRYLPEIGLEAVMRCWENDPKTAYTRQDDPVFKDSCMEIFLDCYPELPYGYLNVEINSAGAMRCRFGPDRQNRIFLAEKGIPRPEVTVTKEKDRWQIRVMFPKKMLEMLYERPCAFAPGHQMRGNFYKCGDETDTPHWTSWTEMRRLDFHDPECFGLLMIA